jgi:hypothetical protein
MNRALRGRSANRRRASRIQSGAQRRRRAAIIDRQGKNGRGSSRRELQRDASHCGRPTGRARATQAHGRAMRSWNRVISGLRRLVAGDRSTERQPGVLGVSCESQTGKSTKQRLQRDCVSKRDSDQLASERRSSAHVLLSHATPARVHSPSPDSSIMAARQRNDLKMILDSFQCDLLLSQNAWLRTANGEKSTLPHLSCTIPASI